MNQQLKGNFGSEFERYAICFLSFVCGLILIYLAIEGPLLLNQIQYKTSPSGIFQIKGQDLINLFILSPILIYSSIALSFKKLHSKYLIIFTPLYLIYFVLSYTIGLEWSSLTYTGNSEKYAFYFLFVMISSLLTLFYALSIFPKKVENSFSKKILLAYSIIFVLFILIFSSMWIKEIISVIKTGTTLGYVETPTMFWTIRFFDLGFTIPIGLLSVYLLWTKPNTTYSIQFMFYGFFITMILAVNAMGIMMYINNDPNFTVGGEIVFVALALIVITGFVFLIRKFKVQ